MDATSNNEPLPPGWQQTTSRSKPGKPCFEHKNGRRMFRRPTIADSTFPLGRASNSSDPTESRPGDGTLQSLLELITPGASAAVEPQVKKLVNPPVISSTITNSAPQANSNEVSTKKLKTAPNSPRPSSKDGRRRRSLSPSRTRDDARRGQKERSRSFDREGRHSRSSRREDRRKRRSRSRDRDRRRDRSSRREDKMERGRRSVERHLAGPERKRSERSDEHPKPRQKIENEASPSSSRVAKPIEVLATLVSPSSASSGQRTIPSKTMPAYAPTTQFTEPEKTTFSTPLRGEVMDKKDTPIDSPVPSAESPLRSHSSAIEPADDSSLLRLSSISDSEPNLKASKSALEAEVGRRCASSRRPVVMSFLEERLRINRDTGHFVLIRGQKFMVSMTFESVRDVIIFLGLLTDAEALEESRRRTKSLAPPSLPPNSEFIRTDDREYPIGFTSAPLQIPFLAQRWICRVNNLGRFIISEEKTSFVISGGLSPIEALRGAFNVDRFRLRVKRAQNSLDLIESEASLMLARAGVTICGLPTEGDLEALSSAPWPGDDVVCVGGLEDDFWEFDPDTIADLVKASKGKLRVQFRPCPSKYVPPFQHLTRLLDSASGEENDVPHALFGFGLDTVRQYEAVSGKQFLNKNGAMHFMHRRMAIETVMMSSRAAIQRALDADQRALLHLVTINAIEFKDQSVWQFESSSKLSPTTSVAVSDLKTSASPFKSPSQHNFMSSPTRALPAVPGMSEAATSKASTNGSPSSLKLTTSGAPNIFVDSAKVSTSMTNISPSTVSSTLTRPGAPATTSMVSTIMTNGSPSTVSLTMTKPSTFVDSGGDVKLKDASVSVASVPASNVTNASKPSTIPAPSTLLTNASPGQKAAPSPFSPTNSVNIDTRLSAAVSQVNRLLAEKLDHGTLRSLVFKTDSIGDDLGTVARTIYGDVKEALVTSEREFVSDFVSCAASAVDWASCIHSPTPVSVSQLLFRMRSTLPGKTEAWYMASLFHFYRTVGVSTLRVLDLDGLPQTHSALAGTYVLCPQLVTPDNNASIEVFLAAGHPLVAGRFALFHFLTQNWILRRLDCDPSEGCICVGNDEGTSWVVCNAVGVWSPSPNVTIRFRTL